MAKNLSLLLYKIKLTTSLMRFLLLLTTNNLVQLLKNLKVLIVLYIFLFIQLILVVFSGSLNITVEKTSDFEKFQELSEQIINFTTTKHYFVEKNLKNVEAEKEKYATSDLLNQTSLNDSQSLYNTTRQFIGRDQLINSALLELADNNQEAFIKLIYQAKVLDPNWEGWK